MGTGSALMAAAVLALPGLAVAQGQPGPPAPADDGMQMSAAQMQQMQKQVLDQMHAVNQMEIQAGQMAKKRGSTRAVRAYGDRLARDHGFADKKIEGLARKLKIQLEPPRPMSDMQRETMKKQMETMAELESLQGPGFDAKFLAAMQMGHTQAISMLTEARQKLPPGDLSSLIGKLLPILGQHLQLANDLSRRVPPQS